MRAWVMLATAVLAGIGLAGCSGDEPFRQSTLAAGNRSHYAGEGGPPWVVVASDKAEWDAFWVRHVEGRSVDNEGTPPRALAVDWDDEVAVAVVLGNRNTDGYAVSANVTPDGGALRVDVVESQPGEGCVTAQILTNPYVLLTVTRSGKFDPDAAPQVSHRKEAEPDC